MNHQEPYIYQLEFDNGKLLYFGSRHSFDPDDKQMDTLTNLFHNYQPDLVLTEAYPEKFDYSVSKQKAVKTHGEFGLIWKLSDQKNIPIHTIESARENEIQFLRIRDGRTQYCLYIIHLSKLLKIKVKCL